MRARVAEGEERERLWRAMNEQYEGFDEYEALRATSRCSCSSRANLSHEPVPRSLFTDMRVVDPQRRWRAASRRCRSPVRHAVLGTPLKPPFPDGIRKVFGMGCFWGAERASGSRPASTRLRSATPAATRRTRPTRRSAAAERARRGGPRRLRPGEDHLRGAAEASGRATTRPRACARATTSAPSTGR